MQLKDPVDTKLCTLSKFIVLSAVAGLGSGLIVRKLGRELGRASLEPRLSVLDFVAQLWRKIGGIRAWKDFTRDMAAVITAVPCKSPKHHNVMGVALSQKC